MRKKTIFMLALCLLLAGCGAKDEETIPVPELESPVKDIVQPEPEEPAGEAGSAAENWVGTWRNDGPGSMSNGRCFMEIACEDGVNYSIDIWWGSSAAETAHWQYTGTYDATRQGIVYTGTHYRETTQADGTVEKNVELENASGLLRLEDGVLIWEDTVEYKNDDMRFNYEG